MAKAHFNRWLEGRAQQMRARCDLAPFARLDPFVLAEAMRVRVFTPSEIPGLAPATATQVLQAGAGEWDAATIPLPDGGNVVVMNPTRPRQRQHASLMEELAHIHLEHKAQAFQVVNGIVLREWKQSHETQAYWVGAAALVPERVMKGAITRRMTISDLATECGVSHELVAFREKVLGLRLQPLTVISP